MYVVRMSLTRLISRHGHCVAQDSTCSCDDQTISLSRKADTAGWDDVIQNCAARNRAHLCLNNGTAALLVL